MISVLYRLLLRLPRFKGKARIEGVFRALLAPRASAVAPGIRMELDPLEWLQIDLLAGRLTEPHTIKLLESLLEPGDTFLDVGAHVGLHSLFAARSVGPAGTVVAIDPQPYNCDRILRNAMASDLGNIVVVAAAAGSANANLTLHAQNGTDKSRLSLYEDSPNNTPFRFRVPVVSLDSLVDELGLGKIKVAKVDVEGFEAEVFKGFERSIAAIEHIIVECLFAGEVETRRSLAALEALERSGFAFRNVMGETYRVGDELPERNVWASRSRSSS